MSILIENCATVNGGVRSIYIEDCFISRVSDEVTQAAPGDVVRINARGATVLPGVADTHCHPFDLGNFRRSADLRGTTSITSLGLRLESKVRQAPLGEWVIGMGWDQEAFNDARFPRREDIDRVTPDNPVLLTRVCGHMALVNSRAVEALNIESAQGAEYERDQTGALTGIIREGALERAFASIPRSGVEAKMNDLLAVEREAAKFGLTTLHCIVSPDGYREELGALDQLRSEGRLALRYRLYIPPTALKFVRESGLRSRLNDDRVRLNGVKIFADGSLGARTAALREPYSDDPGNRGMLRYSDAELQSLVADADRQGCQVIVHAIGDRAVEQATDALSVVTSSKNEKRHRIEHASLAPLDLRSKMKRHEIRVGVQPHYIVSDTWARQRLGDERVRDLYPIRSMLTEGTIASGGSDAPVETLSPLLGIWASMVGAEYAQEERLTLKQAVTLYTANAASNGFDEGISGSIKEGKVADLVLLDSDIQDMHPALLRKVGVAATIADGKVVYSYEGFG